MSTTDDKYTDPYEDRWEDCAGEDGEERNDAETEPHGEQDLERLALLELELPDTADWNGMHAEAAMWQYSVGLDLAEGLSNRHTEAWAAELEKVNDLLFLRDEIEEALAYWGEEFFVGLASDVPELSDLDFRLRDSARQPALREFLASEYRQFRSLINPPQANWWWWLDQSGVGSR